MHVVLSSTIALEALCYVTLTECRTVRRALLWYHASRLTHLLVHSKSIHACMYLIISEFFLSLLSTLHNPVQYNSILDSLFYGVACLLRSVASRKAATIAITAKGDQA
jgi:hypothetical protein